MRFKDLTGFDVHLSAVSVLLFNASSLMRNDNGGTAGMPHEDKPPGRSSNRESRMSTIPLNEQAGDQAWPWWILAISGGLIALLAMALMFGAR
jgi:hypothetical protein